MKCFFRVIRMITTLSLLTLFVALIIIAVLYMESKYIDYRVAQFDLDGDGMFSLTEQTGEMIYWFDKQIGDGGLVFFLYYILLPYSLFISTILYVLFLIVRLIIKKYPSILAPRTDKKVCKKVKR